MVLHDMTCSACRAILPDQPISKERNACTCGKGMLEIYWHAPARDAVVHPNERSVVWRHPKTGKVMYPPRNDVPIPERYRSQGFERYEMPTLRSVERFAEQNNVRSEMAWYDRGSGRGFDDER